MSKGFPLLTTKKMYWKGIVTELIWFLRGDTSIEYLLENDCNIWNGDAYQAYLNKWSYETYPNDGSVYSIDPIKVKPHTKEQFIYRIKTDDYFAFEWGELGPIYGAQWRNWNNGYDFIDQIQNLINDLKTNPDSRRLMVSAWNVGELDRMVLPPCHYGFQVYTRELSFEERHMIWHDEGKKANVSPYMESQLSDMLDRENVPTRAISLMWNQRSVDTPLGLPFNIASYALLLEIIARSVNMVPDELIGNLGDCHIYKNQVDGVEEQLTRETYPLPKLEINSGNENWHLLDDVNDIINSLDCDLTFKIKDYESHPTIKFPLSN
jgi:thymidylate synthase